MPGSVGRLGPIRPCSEHACCPTPSSRAALKLTPKEPVAPKGGEQYRMRRAPKLMVAVAVLVLATGCSEAGDVKTIMDVNPTCDCSPQPTERIRRSISLVRSPMSDRPSCASSVHRVHHTLNQFIPPIPVDGAPPIPVDGATPKKIVKADATNMLYKAQNLTFCNMIDYRFL